MQPYRVTIHLADGQIIGGTTLSANKGAAIAEVAIRIATRWEVDKVPMADRPYPVKAEATR